MFGLVVLLQNAFGVITVYKMMIAVFLNTVDTIYSEHITNLVEMQPQTCKKTSLVFASLQEGEVQTLLQHPSMYACLNATNVFSAT